MLRPALRKDASGNVENNLRGAGKRTRLQELKQCGGKYSGRVMLAWANAAAPGVERTTET